MELSDYRQQIDGIDSQLLALFYQRMEVAAQIAGYKKAHNLPALDAGRERAKLQQIADAAPEDLREYAVSLYSLIFELSRSCQNRLLGVTSPLTAEIEQAIARTPQLFPEHPAVACQGVEGAYSQLACDRLFTMPNVFYCATFEAVFSAIEKGLCRYGVIPLENSTAGSVNAVYDLMMQHNFRIVRSVRLKIDHCLLAKPGTKLSDIKEIYSHEQAISRYLRPLLELPDFLDKLSATLGVRLCMPENAARDDSLLLLEAEPLAVSVGIASMRKKGETVSGDRGTYFKTDAGQLCVILSDGMGCGETAADGSISTVSMLEEFLRSGVSPALAMKLLNSAMLLRDGENWGYATVDLMCMNLFTGEADFYKYGAAPTYVKSGGALKKLRCTSFAPGLEQESGKAPDELHMHLKPGSVAVIASDGVVSDGHDDWLRRLLSDSDDGDMKTLAGSVVRAAIREYGRSDDMTALALKVEVRS